MGDMMEKSSHDGSTSTTQDLECDSAPAEKSDVSQSQAMRDGSGITEKTLESTDEEEELQKPCDSTATTNTIISLEEGRIQVHDILNNLGNSQSLSRNNDISVEQQQQNQNGIPSQGRETRCAEVQLPAIPKLTCRKNGHGGSCPNEGRAPDNLDDDLAKVFPNLCADPKKAQEEPRKRPILGAAISPQKPAQNATVGSSVIPNPIQEISSTLIKQRCRKSSECEEDEHFDVLLLHSEEDSSHSDDFMKLANGQKWKVISVAEFAPNLPKLTAFSSALLKSTYAVLLLTDNFVNDIWCETRYQTALVQSIENPDKKYSVIPVICQPNCKIPTELSILSAVTTTAPSYERVMKRTISIKKRQKREAAAALGSTPNVPISPEKPSFDAANYSLDEIYRSRRPELDPGNYKYASSVIHLDAIFRHVCELLDIEHPLGHNWGMLAEKLGFREVMKLNQEKSPTAQVLECYCQQQLSQKHTKEDILRNLRTKLKEILREDVAQMLQRVMTT